jgi:hypothetical protein
MIDEVNREGGTGFAGYGDWRIPNVKELAGLLDLRRDGPSIDPAFTQQECDDVTSVRCSGTDQGLYWTSTTFADFPAHALGVRFIMGLQLAGTVDDRVKTMRLAVRAVRGPVERR